MSVPFPKDIVNQAWERQHGQCAACCKSLVRANQDKGEVGAWHAHHRKPTSQGGSQTLRNCVILCINEPESCHLEIGHEGTWEHYAPLNDSGLICLYSGYRIRQTIVRQATSIRRRKTQKRRINKTREIFPTLSRLR